MDNLTLPFLPYSRLFNAVEQNLQETIQYGQIRLDQIQNKSTNLLRSFSFSTTPTGQITTKGQASLLLSPGNEHQFPFYLLNGKIDRMKGGSISTFHLSRITEQVLWNLKMNMNSNETTLNGSIEFAKKIKNSIAEISLFSTPRLINFSWYQALGRAVSIGGQINLNIAKKNGMFNLTFLYNPLYKLNDNACLIGARITPILGHVNAYHFVQLSKNITICAYAFLNYFNLESECTIGAKLRIKDELSVRCTHNSLGYLSFCLENIPLLQADDTMVNLSIGANCKIGQYPSFGLVVNCI